MISKSILRTGRRSLPPHLKGPFKQSCEPKVETVPMNKQDINLCVICHEDLLLLAVNTLQCGHVFHDNVSNLHSFFLLLFPYEKLGFFKALSSL